MSDARPRLLPADVAQKTFDTGRRGFVPEQVRSYLDQVARELATWVEREEASRAQLAELEQRVAELEHRVANPVLDEATLTSSLGEQSAQLLRDAHQEAVRIAAEAEARATSVLHRAQERAGERQAQGESSAAKRIAEAELLANAIRARVEEEVAQLLAAAREEAESLVAQARIEGRELLEQAEEVRQRTLADGANRGREIQRQVDQFRNARDQIAAAMIVARDSADQIIGRLAQVHDGTRTTAASIPEREVAAPAAPKAVAPEPVMVEVPADATTEPVMVEPVVPESAEPVEAEPVETVLIDADQVLAAEAPVPDDPVTDDPVTDDLATGDTATGDPATGELAAASVEELFARIRASREEGVEPVTGEVPDEESTVGTPEEGDSGSPAADPEASPDTELVAHRAALLDPVASRLARKLKRVLQDDQNRLLDRLRAGSGGLAAALPDEGEQRTMYAGAAFEHLREAAEAGAAFARPLLGIEAPKRGKGTAAELVDGLGIDQLAEELAGTVVTLLRRRLSGVGEGAGVPEAEEAELVGAAYREWRGDRIERLVGDAALGAFSDGVVALTSSVGGVVRWSTAGMAEPCADCDDNSLAEAISPGEPFPTGHRHPPAHAGCQCLLAPTPAP